MKLRVAFVTLVPAYLGFLACASTTDEAPEPSEVDSGADAPASLPLEAGSPDAVISESDVDGGASISVALQCQQAPCYVAVSGNRSRHVCGLLDDGTVRCWGRDTLVPAAMVDGSVVTPADGALGRGVPVSALEGATPTPVVGLSDVTQLNVGPNLGTCARKSDGSVHCWGRNEFGQLGRPPAEARLPTPTRVEGLPPVDEVQLGFETACAIASADHAIYCWGRTMVGLGVDAGGKQSFVPQLVTTFPSGARALSIGTWTNRDTIAALFDGEVLLSAGEAPVGETSLTTRFPPIPVQLEGVARIGTFAYLASDGVARRWRPAPPGGALSLALYFPPKEQIIDLKISAANVVENGAAQSRASEHQGGALLASGRLFRWGRNIGGTLGVTSESLAGVQVPVEVAQVRGEVVSFATAVESTCASLVSGKVECWGANSYGELGRGAVDLDPHPEAEVIR